MLSGNTSEILHSRTHIDKKSYIRMAAYGAGEGEGPTG